jgi:hypothetical protein
MTTFIYVDRRKAAKGKSAGNRQKLLRRIRDSIRAATPTGDQSKVTANNTGNVNTIKVARNSLKEPTFTYAYLTGERDIVLIGNDRFERGDEFPIDTGGGGGNGSGNGAGPGEESEDDFIVNISRQEYFDVFFEDCELPNLEETHEKDLPQAVNKPAGYQVTGTPAQLAVVRSYRNSRGRQLALSKDDREELEELLKEYDELAEKLGSACITAEDTTKINVRMAEIEPRITELQKKIAAIGAFEQLDLRYRKHEKVQVKSADAVFIMVMDISGSMDEEKKMIARRFFTLQYAFIKRKYPQTDLVFIAHTDEAWEMQEDEFFTTRKSGGTIVSEAYKLAHTIIKERYDPKLTNIYLSQASDGDNWDMDNGVLIEELEDKGLLSKLRFAVYAQVGLSNSIYTGAPSMWTTLSSVSNTHSKLQVVKIPSEPDVYTAFKKIYRKKDMEKRG